MDTKEVTRFEIIDHTACNNCNGQGGTEDVWCHECSGLGTKGRTVVAWDKDLMFDIELQDEGRTLKVFIHDRYE